MPQATGPAPLFAVFDYERQVKLQWAVEQAAGTPAFEARLAEYLGWLTVELTENGEHYTVCHELACFLSNFPTEKAIWDWVRQVGRGAASSLVEAMRMALLELIPEEPRTLETLNALWETALKADGLWMLDEAYRFASPGLREADFRVVQQFRATVGLRPLEQGNG